MNPILQIVMPMPPNVANSRMHNLTRHRAMKKYFAQLDERQNCGLIPPPPQQPLSGVQILAVMVLGASMDDENAKYRCFKWPCDWLKTRGYLVDDKQPHCKMLDPIQCVKRKADYRITFTISPLPKEAQ